MWVTLETARGLWPDAPVDDDILTQYLTSAQIQCAEFAPALPDGAEIPESYVLANVMQARAIYRSLRTGNSDQMGADGFAVTVYPLDWNIRALLRPKRGKPVLK